MTQNGSVLGLRAAGVRVTASSRGTVSCVLARFQADLGTNLIKQGVISQVDRSAWYLRRQSTRTEKIKRNFSDAFSGVPLYAEYYMVIHP